MNGPCFKTNYSAKQDFSDLLSYFPFARFTYAFQVNPMFTHT